QENCTPNARGPRSVRAPRRTARGSFGPAGTADAAGVDRQNPNGGEKTRSLVSWRQSLMVWPWQTLHPAFEGLGVIEFDFSGHDGRCLAKHWQTAGPLPPKLAHLGVPQTTVVP